jgi:hypothetical protein
MAVNYPNNVKVARMQAVVDLVSAGSGPGRLEICNAAYAQVLATITLGDPAATVAGAGVATYSGFPRSDTAADVTGTAALARIVDSDGNVVFDGLTVGTSGTDVVLVTTEIVEDQAIQINSCVVTHAA